MYELMTTAAALPLGDDTPIALYVILLACAAAVVIILVVRKKRK